VAKNQFLQHARVLVAADKYMAVDLTLLALNNLRQHVNEEMKHDGRRKAFFKYMVLQVYQHPQVFGLDMNTAEGSREAQWHPSSTNEQNEIENIGTTEEITERDLPARKCNGAEESETDDFDERDILGLMDDPSNHTQDHMKRITVKTAFDVWHRDTEELGRKELAVLVKRIPDFGTDLALYALGAGAVENDSPFVAL